MSLSGYWNYLMVDLADPRSRDWPLMKDPFTLITILACYYYFVKDLGPKLMANRKPFELQKVLVLYNFIQVLISVYLVYEGIEIYFYGDYSLKCQSFDRRRTKQSMRVVKCYYLYTLAKITELLDTIFFVLRKKDSQISFLHVYHHAAVPLASWGCTKYMPGGHITLFGTINSFVHVFMYFYYMLSAMGPEWQKFLWWKKYITILQMVQFCVGGLYSIQILFFNCGFPRWTLFIILPNAVAFYVMFSNFYMSAYKASKNKLMQSETKTMQSKLNDEASNGSMEADNVKKIK